MNDCGFPAATIEKPQFCNLLTCIMDDFLLITSEDLHLTNKALMEMQISSLNEFV